MTVGVACPACGDRRSATVDSRAKGDHVHRRRRCRGCGHRWSTYETSYPVTEIIEAVQKLCGGIDHAVTYLLNEANRATKAVTATMEGRDADPRR